jgi:hypothetical protein
MLQPQISQMNCEPGTSDCGVRTADYSLLTTRYSLFQ